MKILMFQYNRDVSAIISQNTLGKAKGKRQLNNNAILASGYSDRLLWEEAASLKAQPKSEYIIPGTWQ